MHSSPRPAIPAEALRRVAEPLATALRAGPAAPSAVVRAIVEALQPAEANIDPPDWLRPGQRPLVRRCAAAMARHGGALLAEPVGAGKTWMALALAQVLQPDEPTPVLVPAPLRRQWIRIAAGLGVRVTVGTHSAASRGRLPDGGRFAIIDESQHFRTAGTKRHLHTARWLVGRRALLLSATPVVNRLDDLAAQLLLVIRDSALAEAGVPSLTALLAGDAGHPALGEVLVARARSATTTTTSRAVTTVDDTTALVASIEALRFSPSSPVRELLRNVFCRAAASSPAALAETARRYARLLQHAGDAAAAGRRIDRALVRQLAGAELEQLVLWELLPDAGAPALELADLPAVQALERQALADGQRDDTRIAALRHVLADGRRSVVFTTRRATLGWLRARLADARLAWCTGSEAGIGPGRVARAAVLDWFRADIALDATTAAFAPRHLLTTDVAAEGLDLGGAERVVHYDLPWTDARLAQREGRLQRGAVRPREVVTIPPPPALAARLGVHAILARKRRLPARIGLASEGDELWLWRERLLSIASGTAPRPGLARVASERAGILVGYRVAGRGDGGSVSLVWLHADGTTEAPELLRALLTEAADAPSLPLGAGERRAVLTRIAGHLRMRVQASQRSAWQPMPGREGVTRLLARLWEFARRAARDRDQPLLARLQAAVRFVGGGHTAGEAALVARLADADDTTLRRALASLPPATGADLPTLRLVGAIVFGARLASGARAATFGRHDTLHDGALRPRRDADRLDPADPRQLSPHPAGARLPGTDG
ncbi:MAG TPA: helicase-related protein [Gemmatimonadales bacterium]|nr:helicase-related protein [Gemmatimonadales bacterium]